MIINNVINLKLDHLIEEAEIEREVNLFMIELQEASIIETFKDMSAQTKKIVKTIVTAIKNPQKMKAIVESEKKAQKRRKDYLKKYNINIDKFQKDLKEGKDISIPLKMILEEMFDDLLKSRNNGKVIGGTLVAGTAIIILQIFMDVMKLFLPINMAVFLSTIILVPLGEELMKRLSVKFKTSGVSFLAFNAMETFINYQKLSGLKIGFADMSIIGLARIFAITMHLITWMMHAKGNMLDKYKTDFKIETDQKDKYKNAASFQATLAHSLYNGLPMLLGKFTGSDTAFFTLAAAISAGTLTVLEKTKAKKEFSKAVDKFLKPLRGQKIPKKITA